MNNTPINAENLINDPTWFPNAMDMGRGLIQFVRVDRDTLAREAFLDARMTGSVKGIAEAAIASLGEIPAEKHPSPAYIFHTAFCCSTLLARALDAPGRALSLKEPDILMGLANAYRMARNETERREADIARELILQLLARPHQDGEHVLIKPTNTANNLAPMTAPSGARIILLYSDLKGFLVSVLKKGEACKAFVRKQFNIFALEKEGVGAIPDRQALGLTDLQIAALVWRHQMEMFTKMLSAPASDNLRSLDFRIFLDRPADTLIAANAHFQLGIPEKVLQDAATGPIFQKNSKAENQQYDAGARARDEAELISRHEEELSMIEGWALNLKLAVDIPKTLPKPLL